MTNRRRLFSTLPSRRQESSFYTPRERPNNYEVLEHVGNKHQACPKYFNAQGKLKVNITNKNMHWTQCPISLNKASNPHIIVGDPSGSVYSKNALKQWFNSGSKKCPVTGKNYNKVKIAPLPKELKVLGDWNGRTKSTRLRSYQAKPKTKSKKTY